MYNHNYFYFLFFLKKNHQTVGLQRTNKMTGLAVYTVVQM
jgi:hypothetical protein